MARRRISHPAGPRTGAGSRSRGGRPAGPRPPGDDARARLDRIREISALARTTWFGLVAYLAFVGITLLGVEDADFFVPARQTKLPLADVTIPTASFFLFGPILGAALYAYLHLQLVKLWDAMKSKSGLYGSARLAPSRRRPARPCRSTRRGRRGIRSGRTDLA